MRVLSCPKSTLIMQQTKDLASDDGIIMSYESIRVDSLYFNNFGMRKLMGTMVYWTS